MSKIVNAAASSLICKIFLSLHGDHQNFVLQEAGFKIYSPTKRVKTTVCIFRISWINTSSLVEQRNNPFLGLACHLRKPKNCGIFILGTPDNLWTVCVRKRSTRREQNKAKHRFDHLQDKYFKTTGCRSRTHEKCKTEHIFHVSMSCS